MEIILTIVTIILEVAHPTPSVNAYSLYYSSLPPPHVLHYQYGVRWISIPLNH